MTARLLSLAAVVLARLGFLRCPVLAVTAPAMPIGAAILAITPVPRFSLGIPGGWTPMTGSEP